ncbi:hypothetical protein J8F10_21550 [Gemmata sp. G18]|uniref:Uncharacterized protein n=1 Tax=Gemmata palustris TaxID=2822762 RepID=A0ABS5BVU5_9BACT|nr:hypothetical protein [Gemmata palustris]MBP3957847.1 hypothetical protein [Gemmata palustris]
MNPADRLLWLDTQAAHYLAAVEADDFDRQDALWALAAHDHELEEALHAVHAGLAEEAVTGMAAAVAAAVGQFLPSAGLIHPTGGPVTVGMVADELFRHTPGRLPPAAHALNETLRRATDELPADLGLPELTDWMVAKFGPVPTEYLKAFRHAATKVRMRASPEAEYQLAARRAKPAGGPS